MSNAAYVQSVLDDKFGLISSGLSQAELGAMLVTVVEQLSLPDIAMVSIIGGAASGKSTIAEEVVADLQKHQIKTDMLCTDNYVVGDREYRQQILKDADAQKKYDFKLMDEHIRKISALDDGQTIDVPVIDSKTGVSVDRDKADYDHTVGKIDVLVIEGDFPRDDYDIRFYVHVPDEQRLQNNIERETDNDDDADVGTLTQGFNDRQRTLHKPYTLPALQSADYVLVANTDQDDWTYDVFQRRQ